MPEGSIQEVLPNQMGEAYKVHTDSFSENAADFLTIQGFMSLTEAPNATLLGFEAGKTGEKTITGYILFRQIGPEAELLSMAIAPNSRKRGFGLKLINAMNNRLKSSSPVQIFLEVNEKNLAAIGLYERAGFTGFGIRPGYYRQIGRASENAILMKFDLR